MRSLPHVLNQASQDHFSPFLHRADGSCQNSQPDDIAQTTETLYFNHSIAVKGPAIRTPLYYKDLTRSPASQKKNKHTCMFVTQKSQGDSSQNWDLTVQKAVFINMNQPSISTLSISHLKCFLKHVLVGILWVRDCLGARHTLGKWWQQNCIINALTYICIQHVY